VSAVGQEGLKEVAKEKGHTIYVTALCFSKDGKLAVSADGAGTVKVWEVGSGLREKLSLRASRGKGVLNSVNDVALSPDGKYLAAATGDQSVWLWEAKTGKVVRRVRGHKDSVRRVIFLGKGEQALSVDKRGTCFIWDVEKEAEPETLNGYTSAAAASPDGKVVALYAGGKTKTYNVKSGKEVADLGFGAAFLAFSPDGKHVVKCAGGYGGRIALCDAKTGKEVWGVKGHTTYFCGLYFTADGKRIVSADFANLRVWDAKDGDELGRFHFERKGNGTLSRFALAPDGRTVLLGNDRGLLTLAKIPD
jgi:WD40 repeat protein